jgi:hypothetical protein
VTTKSGRSGWTGRLAAGQAADPKRMALDSVRLGLLWPIHWQKENEIHQM